MDNKPCAPLSNLAAALLICIAIAPGLLAAAICAHFLFLDWALLTDHFILFEKAASSGNLAQITAENALQMSYRINCFAEGVGLMLGLILAAIGLHAFAAIRHGQS